MTQSFDADAFRTDYERRRGIFEALKSEVCFILDDLVKREGIKIHLIESRLKQFDSIVQKCNRKNIFNPLSALNDIVGVRIICLFRSDILKIENILKQHFVIKFSDNKIETSVDSFGYMSVHYVCELHSSLRGRDMTRLRGWYLKFR